MRFADECNFFPLFFFLPRIQNRVCVDGTYPISNICRLEQSSQFMYGPPSLICAARLLLHGDSAVIKAGLGTRVPLGEQK